MSGTGPGGVVLVDSNSTVLFSTLRVFNYPNVTDLVTGAATPVRGPDPTSLGAQQQTRLHSGAILVTGGTVAPGPPNFTPATLNNASLFSPATLSFTPAASMATPRAYHTSVVTLNGTALVISGLTYAGPQYDFDVQPRDAGGTATTSIEAFNPFTNTWSPAGNMLTAKSGHVSVVLPSGKILSTGGYVLSGFLPASAESELYDPVLGVSTATGNMTTPRADFQMILLADGTALACGGANTVGEEAEEYENLFSCERYFEGNGTWVPTGNLSMTTAYAYNGQPYTPPWLGGFILSQLPNNQVLASSVSPQCSPQLSLFEPSTGTWLEPAPGALFGGPQILLPTGELLVGNAFTAAQCQGVGGPGNATGVDELYNPLTGGARFGTLHFGSGGPQLLF